MSNEYATSRFLNGKTTAASTVVIAIVLVLNTVLPYFGVNFGRGALTSENGVKEAHARIEGTLYSLKDCMTRVENNTAKVAESSAKLADAINILNQSASEMLILERQILKEAEKMDRFRKP